MDLDVLFSRIVEEMPGYLAAAAGSLKPGSKFYSHSSGRLDLADTQDRILKLVQDYVGIYDDLGGAIDFGSNDEILITASHVYLLIKIDHNSQRFIAVLLGSNGNIGYLRFRMRNYLRLVPDS